MTIFMVNGQEKELRYDMNGIDISNDFIGNTAHGMEYNEDGNYIATEKDFQWWQETIAAHENMDAIVSSYKERFDADDVREVVEDWADGDLENDPPQVIMGLERNFGKIS